MGAALALGTADPPIPILAAAAVVGVVVGVALDPLVRARSRRLLPAPPGTWTEVEEATGEHRILRAG